MPRPAQRSDLDAIAALVARWEEHWFGAPEQDLDEVAETLDLIDDWSHDVRVHERDDRIVVAAWRWRHDRDLLVDPGLTDPAPATGELIDWLGDDPAAVLRVFEPDEHLRDAVAERGWQHVRSAFELSRDVEASWQVAAPELPGGVRLAPYVEAHRSAVHRLVYRDAGWADVPGHEERDEDEWASLFLAPQTRPEPPVVAWRDDRPVGVTLSRVFADGTGWVSQLAVARTERGLGLGRALLLETVRRLRAAGAGRIALGVQAGNAGALRLYEDVGLRVDRHFLGYSPGRSSATVSSSPPG